MSDLTVGIRDLKARLSEYLQRVRQGQAILITDRGRPVGRILPVDAPLSGGVMPLGQWIECSS